MSAGARIAVHVHSSWAYDGHWSLPRLASSFRRRGYDAVLVCEHDRGFTQERKDQHRQACLRHSRDIVLIPGIEYSDPDNVVHVPVWGDVPFLGEGLPTADLLRGVAQHDGVALLAHPSRNDAAERIDPQWLSSFCGVELWSRKYDGWRPNPALGTSALGGLTPYASLDFHRRRQFAPLATVADLDAAPSEGAILDAMRRSRVRATAFRQPIGIFVDGRGARALAVADAVRRPVAAVARRLLP